MKYPIYFLTLCFCSCGPSPSEKPVDKIIERITTSDENEITKEEAEPKYVPSKPPVFAMEGLDFGHAGYIVSIDSIDIIDYKGDVILPKNDTCSYFLDLGENIINVPLRISPTIKDQFVRFEVFQRALYHFSISNEGPHCDMIEEEPYYGNWIELSEKKPNYSFRTLRWDQMKAPKVDLTDEEFKALALKHCSERYADLLGNEYVSASANDHIGTSGYEIKIIATKADGSADTSFIYFSTPMGC